MFDIVYWPEPLKVLREGCRESNVQVENKKSVRVRRAGEMAKPELPAAWTGSPSPAVPVASRSHRPQQFSVSRRLDSLCFEDRREALYRPADHGYI